MGYSGLQEGGYAMSTKTTRTVTRRKNQLADRGPSILVGCSGEVSRALNRTPARRTVAVTFESEGEISAAEEVYRRIGEFLPQLIRERQQERLARVVEALLPDIAPSGPALAQAKMMVEAKRSILDGGDYIPASEIAKLAGYSEINPSAQPNKWKRDGAIFAVQHNGIDYFPLFALDSDANYKPYPTLKEVLSVFQGSKSGWSLAFWFAGLNSFLEDRRPQDLLATEPERVVAAARDEIEGLTHG
jgi:hypothetical protein